MGALRSVATQSEFAKFKAAARATAIQDRRVSIRLSSGDLSDIQVKALEEGVPFQTLIASVLHKHVTGRLAKPPVPRAKPRRSRASQRRSPMADWGSAVKHPASDIDHHRVVVFRTTVRERAVRPCATDAPAVEACS